MPDIEREVSLAALNTLGVNSVAERFHRLENPADLPALLDMAQAGGWRVRVLGGGSNVVLAPRLPGLVIQQACRGVDVVEQGDDSVLLSVAAGENWHDLVAWCLDRGYHGLENLALIPGTVGAAPIQNIGAYGVEVAGFVEAVQCRSLQTGTPQALSRQDCRFGYRDSVFKGALRDQVIIESVQLRLDRRFQAVVFYPSLAAWLEQAGIHRPSAQEVFDAVVAIRRTRLPDPSQVPNAGSFFRNPQVDGDTLQRLLEQAPGLPHFPDESRPGGFKLAAAWLIEQCGFKRRQGRVRVHPDHALVIINPERADAGAIQDFAAEIAAAVESRFGLRLEQEPCHCD